MRQPDEVSATGGGPVRLGSTLATFSVPESPGQRLSRLNANTIGCDMSHLAISEPGGPSSTGPASRIPTLRSSSSVGVTGLDSRSRGVRHSHLEPTRDLSHTRHAKPRRDSTQPSLPDPNVASIGKVSQSRTIELGANQVRNPQSSELSKVDHQSSPSVADVLPTSATTQNQTAVRTRPTIVTQPAKSRSFLTTGVRAAERRVRSLLEPPQVTPVPTLSAHPSIEIISDGGEDRHLIHESYSDFDIASQRTGLDDEDDDPSLSESVASLPPPASAHDLMSELMEARIFSHNNEGQTLWFIPKKELRRVINRKNVKSELRRQLPLDSSFLQKIDSYANMVCQDLHLKDERTGNKQIKSFRKVFALLVLAESSLSIFECLKEENELSDQDLPLTLHINEKKLPGLSRRNDSKRHPIKCFEKWGPIKLENFYRFQWWLLAPFFSPDSRGVVRHYVLQDDHIMPYISPRYGLELPSVKIGGYGEVHMVYIHPDHHEFKNNMLCELGFAVKKQKHEDYRNMFKREAEILRKFSGDRCHPHVVSLLATYEQFRKIHLIFYRAQATLEEYWREVMPRPRFTYVNVIWFAKQCWGVSDGLLRLHKILPEISIQTRNPQIQQKPGKPETLCSDQILFKHQKMTRAYPGCSR